MKIIVISKMKKSKKVFLMTGAALIIGLVIVMANYGIKGVMGKDRKLPIYCVDAKDKKIAISFDASWGANNTVKILDILDKHNVKATFFLVGRWVDEFPEETKEIYKRGHEIGNHSNTHPDMTKIPDSKIVEELAATDAKIIYFMVYPMKTLMLTWPPI